MQKEKLRTRRMLSEKEIKRFNDFVANEKSGNIHQIAEWGRFQAGSAMRDKCWFLVVENGKEEILASAVVVRQRLPIGRCWLFMPRGPVMDFSGAQAREVFGELVREMKKLAQEEKAVFWRVDPGVIVAKQVMGAEEADEKEKSCADDGLSEEEKKLTQGYADLLKKQGFKLAHAHYQPENTIMVNLEGSDEAILAQMKPKGRYNIRLAEKKGVEVFVAGEGKWSVEKGVAEFHRLLVETTSRDGFSGHDQKYYENMLKELGSEQVKLYLAEYQGEVIAGIVATFYQDAAIYYFGASGNKHRNVMAPYLLQWVAMKEARARGIKWYDFLGVAPLGVSKDHPWSGVTEFKEKFGGVRFDYFPAQELVFDGWMFWAMKLNKWVKRMLRR